MKKLIENFIIIMVLTIAILFSYALIEKKISGRSSSEFINFLFSTQEKASSNKSSVTSNKGNSKKGNNSSTQSADTMNYRAVWLSYLEFNSYRKSVKNNNESSFRKFYKHILQQIKTIGCNRIIVQVRPFGDALYASDYFPWAACISGTQGKNPGYDPLKIMTEMSHKEGISIEAWINPYRISSGNSIRSLSKTNPARKWFSVQNTKRNILSYEGSLYYNPSSESVRNLIIQGVKEIVQNYNVDGIHMDDYFYPSFTEKNVTTAFDAPEYKQQLKTNLSSTDSTSLTSADKSSNENSLAGWRRDNVNRLVSGIYKAVKEINSDVTFGISPAGNLDNLRNDLEYYVDIDTWVSQNGYVDYLMPQIYWGFTNEIAPFDKVTDEIGTVNTQELQNNVNKYLKDTDVPELQPDYLKDQMSEAIDKIKDAGKEIVKNPENADKVFDSTADSLQDQAKKIGDSVDKNAIANAVAKNSDLSQEEAQQATDNIYNELKTASDEAQKQIDTARTNLDKAKDDLKESIDEARQVAEDASNTTAKASIWGFVAMVVGLIITSLSGLLGANLVKNPEREHKM